MQLRLIRSYDASEDMKACTWVLSGNGADWKKTSFRIHSRWRPELSVAFSVSFYLGRDLSPWTGRHLDATEIPPAIAALRQSIQLFHDPPMVVAISEMERLLRIVDTDIKRAVEFIYSTACVVSTTPFGALNSITRAFAQKAAVLAVDEAAEIDEATSLSVRFCTICHPPCIRRPPTAGFQCVKDQQSGAPCQYTRGPVLHVTCTSGSSTVVADHREDQ